MLENDKMNNELSFQSRQTEDIIEENNKLREEIKMLKRRVEMLSQMEEELSKKNQSNQQAIKMLLNKV